MFIILILFATSDFLLAEDIVLHKTKTSPIPKQARTDQVPAEMPAVPIQALPLPIQKVPPPVQASAQIAVPAPTQLAVPQVATPAHEALPGKIPPQEPLQIPIAERPVVPAPEVIHVAAPVPVAIPAPVPSTAVPQQLATQNQQQIQVQEIHQEHKAQPAEQQTTLDPRIKNMRVYVNTAFIPRWLTPSPTERTTKSPKKKKHRVQDYKWAFDQQPKPKFT